MKPVTLSALIALSALTCSYPAFAQVQSDAPTPQEIQDQTKDVLGSGAPLSRPASAISGTTLQIATSRGEQEISLGIDFELFSSAPVNPLADEDGTFRVSSLDLTITGSAPISGDDENTGNLFTGGSFVNGTRVAVGLTFFSALQKDARGLTQGNSPLYDRITRACSLIEARVFAGNNPERQKLAGEFENKVLDFKETNQFLSNFIQIRLPQENKEFVDISKHVTNRCILNVNFTDLVKKYLPSATAELYEAALVTEPMTFLGVNGAIGNNGFDVLDRTNFDVNNVVRTPWEVEGYVGRIGANLNWSARASFSYGAGYDAAESIELCRTAIDGTQECIEGPDGAPSRNESGRFAVEYRRLFNLKSGDRIGIAPEVTYDIDQDDVLVELPVYFSPDEDGKLTGGILASYDSEDDDVSVGLFVGVPFSVAF